MSAPDTLKAIQADIDAALDAAIAVDPEPVSKLALAGSKAAFDLVVGLVDGQGQAGLQAAIDALTAIRDHGAHPITDAELATDDAAVQAKIAEWYAA